jgi:hypothetical protein
LLLAYGYGPPRAENMGSSKFCSTGDRTQRAAIGPLGRWRPATTH